MSGDDWPRLNKWIDREGSPPPPPPPVGPPPAPPGEPRRDPATQIPAIQIPVPPPPQKRALTAVPDEPTGVEQANALRELDQSAVREIRQRVSRRLEELRQRQTTTMEQERAAAPELIRQEAQRWAEEQLRTGQRVSPMIEAALRRAVYDRMYGLGPLQPLLEDERIENIEIDGYDNIWVTYSGQQPERIAPIVENDAELEELIRNFAAREGQTAREFSTARPILHLRLSDGSRLTAVKDVSKRIGVAIRRHRLVDVDLDDLVRIGSLDTTLRDFLRAAVRARMNIVVTGGMNAGKTTLVRALANEVGAHERIATIESEFELHLGDLPHRHPRLIEMEARQGSSEDDAGEVTLYDLLVASLRLGLDRIIVGEVKGPEIVPMLMAMSCGHPGSLSTIHANSAVHVFNRIASMASVAPDRRTQPLNREGAFSYTADALDLVVHVELVDLTSMGGGRHRYVSEIVEVLPVGDSGMPGHNQIFKPGPDGRAVAAGAGRLSESRKSRLYQAGFHPNLLSPPPVPGMVRR